MMHVYRVTFIKQAEVKTDSNVGKPRVILLNPTAQQDPGYTLVFKSIRFQFNFMKRSNNANTIEKVKNTFMEIESRGILDTNKALFETWHKGKI